MANILVLDSGVGGLSICQALLSQLDDVQIRYVADDACFPYGIKDEAFLIERLSQLIKLSEQRFEFDLIVIACNTASTLVLPALRSLVKIPVIGVVPAIKPASALTQTKKIALLATPGTVSRSYTQQLIDDFASDCEVVRVGSRVLVEQAERLLNGVVLDVDAIERELQEIISDDQIDTVVLGCTHFPLLKDVIAPFLPGKGFVDSAQAIARRAESLLVDLPYKASNDDKHFVMFTGTVPKNKVFESSLERLGMRQVVLSKFDI